MSSRPKWKTRTDYDGYDTNSAQFILAAADIIAEEGIDNLRLEDVAQRCGCVRQTVYRYFGSKKELAQAVLMHFTLLNGEEVAKHVKGISDPEDRLVEIIYFGAANLVNNPKYKIFMDVRNSRLFNSLSGDSLPSLLEGYKFEEEASLLGLTTKNITAQEFYTWLTMQIVALANMGLVGKDKKRTKDFIRNLIVRGPL